MTPSEKFLQRMGLKEKPEETNKNTNDENSRRNRTRRSIPPRIAARDPNPAADTNAARQA